MRDVCQIDAILNTRLKMLPPDEAAKKIFENFRNCRVLSTASDGLRLRVTLLLPELPGGYGNCNLLRLFFDEGTAGKGVVLSSVYVLREATPSEVLQRTLSKRNGTR